MNKVQLYLLSMDRKRQLMYLEEVFKNSCIGCKRTNKTSRTCCDWRDTTPPKKQARVILKNLSKKGHMRSSRKNSFMSYRDAWITDNKMTCSDT